MSPPAGALTTVDKPSLLGVFSVVMFALFLKLDTGGSNCWVSNSVWNALRPIKITLLLYCCYTHCIYCIYTAWGQMVERSTLAALHPAAQLLDCQLGQKESHTQTISLIIVEETQTLVYVWVARLAFCFCVIMDLGNTLLQRFDLSNSVRNIQKCFST